MTPKFTQGRGWGWGYEPHSDKLKTVEARDADSLTFALSDARMEIATLRKALEAVRFSLLNAGYHERSIMIEGIDAALAAKAKQP
jgi:hypothetical protein